MTDTTTATERRVSKLGFPIEDCKRCGGTGHYSYNQIHGTMCYGCAGKGYVYTKPAQPEVTALIEARDAVRWIEVPAGEWYGGVRSIGAPHKARNPNPPKIDAAPYVARALAAQDAADERKRKSAERKARKLAQAGA